MAALRTASLPVSPADSLDALKAARQLGFANRQLLRTGLSCILAKSEQERGVFEEVFDRFFAPPQTDVAADDNASAHDLPPINSSLESPLGQMLMAGDSVALTQQMVLAGRQQKVEQIEFFTQKGLYARRILEAMGLLSMEQNLDSLAPSEQALLRERLAVLRGRVQDYVEQQFLTHADSTGRRLRESLLRQVKLSNADARTIEQMQPVIERMARRLRTLYRHSRRKQKGRLDVPATLRANNGLDGLPFHLRWRYRHRKRAHLFVICDLSGSMRRSVKFMLMLLYALQLVLPKIRSFGFVDRLNETTDLFDGEPFEQAMQKMIERCSGGSTDYARSLADFENLCGNDLTSRSTLIILGDGRNNYANPENQRLARLYRRCRRLIWLNPESRYLWFSGDSAMRDYLPYCHQANTCSTLDQLERFADRLLAAHYSA